MRVDRRAHPDLPRGGRGAVRQIRPEPVAEEMMVERSGRRDQHGEILMKSSRELAAIVPEHEVRHPIQGLAEQASGLAGGDQIVNGRLRRFAGHLPSEAADVRIREGRPESEPGRTRPAIHRGALVRMPELIHIERIRVLHPMLRAKVVPDRRRRGVEDFLAVLDLIAERDPIVGVEYREKARELDRRNEVTGRASRVGTRLSAGARRRDGDRRDGDQSEDSLAHCTSRKWARGASAGPSSQIACEWDEVRCRVDRRPRLPSSVILSHLRQDEPREGRDRLRLRTGRRAQKERGWSRIWKKAVHHRSLDAKCRNAGRRD